MQNSKTLSGKALRALHQLWQILKDAESPLNISFNLFVSLVASVLNYVSEVWGFMHAECIERVHPKFCIYMLNVKISTTNYAVYNELGRYQLIVERHISIVKYWFSLLQKSKNNCVLNAIYPSMEANLENDTQSVLWLSKLKCLLEGNDFAKVWYYPHSVDSKLFIPLFKRRLIDSFLVVLQEGLNVFSSMTMYRELKYDFDISDYLKILHNKKT